MLAMECQCMPIMHATETDSDTVRRYVRERYIDPARQRGETTVRVVAGEVHKALGLSNRVPLVCAALKSDIFLKDNGLSLNQIEGPPSGLSTTVAYTYGLGQHEATAGAPHPLWNLRGVAKSLYQEYGGGEAHIQAERKAFFGLDEKANGTAQE